MKQSKLSTFLRRDVRYVIILLALTTALFLGLYSPFFFGGQMYVYTDIGSDTINTYLPNIIYDLRSFASGTTDLYVLDRGLGEYAPSLLYKYLNGVNLPLLILGERRLYWGILFATYLKYCVISTFGGLFFRRLFRREDISVLCALLWTFSGYAVLWGQHYHLLTSITMFTVMVYGMQLLLEGDRKWFLFVPAAACMAYTGYFYLWMGCFFLLGYSLCYLILRRASVGEILKKAVLAIACLAVGCLIAAEYIFPSLEEILGSSRVDNITAEQISQGFVYSADYLFAFLARLLSPNLLGVGNAYSGVTNYYEIAIIGTGILLIVSFVLLLQSPKKKTAVVLFVLGALLLACPYVSKLISMRSTTQRWTFILLLGEVIAIGYGLKYLAEIRDEALYRRTLLRTMVITDAAVAVLFLIVRIGEAVAGYKVNMGGALVLFGSLCVYNAAAMILAAVSLSEEEKIRGLRRFGAVLLTAAVCAELLMVYYPAINDRMTLTRREWHETGYYDGTRELAAWIQTEDPDLYRIAKTYDSVSRNDEMVQSFNGVAVYNSLNARWLTHFYRSMGYSTQNTATTTGTNYVRFDGDDIVENALLGVKYVLVNVKEPDPLAPPPEADGEPEEEISSENYELIYSEGEYGFKAYRSRYVDSFGYLYDERIDTDLAVGKMAEVRKLLLSRYYYLTEENVPGADVTRDDEIRDVLDDMLFIDLLNEEITPVNCAAEHTADGLVITPSTADMQLYWFSMPFDDDVHYDSIEVRLTAQEDGMIQLFTVGEGEDFSENSTTFVDIRKGTGTYVLRMPHSRGLRAMRIDPANSDLPITIHSMTLNATPIEKMNDPSHLQKLYANGEVEIRRESDGRFTGTVTNTSDHEQMLCVPVIYHERWKVKVDGAGTEAKNINGGLIGIPVGTGTHTIEMVYRYDVSKWGRLTGAVTFCLYLAAVLIYVKVRKRRETAGKTA